MIITFKIMVLRIISNQRDEIRYLKNENSLANDILTSTSRLIFRLKPREL